MKGPIKIGLKNLLVLEQGCELHANISHSRDLVKFVSKIAGKNLTALRFPGIPERLRSSRSALSPAKHFPSRLLTSALGERGVHSSGNIGGFLTQQYRLFVASRFMTATYIASRSPCRACKLAALASCFFVKFVKVAQKHLNHQATYADVISEECLKLRFSSWKFFYRDKFGMNTRRLFRMSGLLATLVLAPSLVFAQTDGVRWRSSLDAAKVEASQTDRLVLLHFWSPSCGPCRKLESTVFPLPQVGAAIEKNYVPVKINAVASSAMAYAFKVDRVPSDVILTAHGNIVTTYTSPLTREDYLAKLSGVVAQFGNPGSNPVQNAAPQQVNAAYAGLQPRQVEAASNPVGNSVAQASTSSVTPATSALATTGLNRPPASQPSQSVNRYALPARPRNSPKKPGIPSNAMPSSYRNPYMTSQMQTSAVAQQNAPAVIQNAPAGTQNAPTVTRGQKLATTHTVSPTVTSNKEREPQGKTLTATNVPKTSHPLQLPAGSPPLGFDGYCPVTLKFDKKWVRGNVQFGAIHRGRTYLFAGDQQRQQFLANPDAYSPVFSGMDPVALLDNKQTIEGSRKFGFEYRGAFYLFSSSETMRQFASQPDRYAVGVRQAMARHDAGTGIFRR